MDKLRIELSSSKNNKKFLEKQLLEEEQMRISLNHQLQEKEEQISRLIQEKSQLQEMSSQDDDLMSKYEMMKKESVALKEASENREHADQELVASVVKERDHYKMKWEAEKEKGRVISLVLEEEKDLKAQYRVQAESEFEARRVAESNIKRYLAQINNLRDRISTLQAELETQEEELKMVQEQRSEWKECTAEIEVQLNS